ncbi:MAG: hypothetical protein WBF17_18025, partial [Phycisphaerae bacterium]
MRARSIGLAGETGGAVLRRTELAEAYVLLVLVLLVLGTWLLVGLRASDRKIGRAFCVASTAYLVSVTALGLVGFRILQKLCWEDHLLEWLSAEALFVAAVLAALIAVRQARRGQPG